MASVSLSPIKEFLLDLVNTLHHATALELQVKQAEQWARKLDRLDFLMSQSADIGSELDEELAVSDTTAITKEKEGRFLDVQQIRAELEGIVSSLQGLYETPLEGVISADDDESVQRYGRHLISWFESIRGHLIEILGRTKILLTEREERKRLRKEECKLVQELLNQMVPLRTYVTKIESKLNEVAQHHKLTTSGKIQAEPMPTLPDRMEVDDDPTASWQTGAVTAEILYPVSNLSNPEAPTGSDFTALLEDTKANLREFRASRPTYASKADLLHDQTTKALQNAPPGYPIIPVRNVEIELHPAIRQIVVEEFESLYGHFISSLTEETGKKEEEAVSKLSKTMGDANKLVCKLLVSCLGCDEIVLEDAPRMGVQIPHDTIVS